MTFYFLFFFDSFKRLLLLTNLFLVLQTLIIKLLILLLLAMTLYLILHIPDFNKINTRFRKLSKLRNFRNNFLESVVYSYKITKSSPLQSFTYLLGVTLYISIFIFGILYIKIHNFNSQIDLRKTLESLLEKTLILSPIDKIILFLAVTLTYLIFITALYKIKNLFNKPIFAVHYYLWQTEWYPKLVIEKIENFTNLSISNNVNNKIDNAISFMVLGKIPLFNSQTGKIDNLTDLESSLYLHNKSLNFIQKKIRALVYFSIDNSPSLLIFFCILLDFFLNNFTLHYTFFCYPFAYILQIWLNISEFTHQRSFMSDDEVKDLIYHSFSNNPQSVVIYMLNEFKSQFYLESKERKKFHEKWDKQRRKVRLRRILRKLEKLFVKSRKAQ